MKRSKAIREAKRTYDRFECIGDYRPEDKFCKKCYLRVECKKLKGGDK